MFLYIAILEYYKEYNNYTEIIGIFDNKKAAFMAVYNTEFIKNMNLRPEFSNTENNYKSIIDKILTGFIDDFDDCQDRLEEAREEYLGEPFYNESYSEGYRGRIEEKQLNVYDYDYKMDDLTQQMASQLYMSSANENENIIEEEE